MRRMTEIFILLGFLLAGAFVAGLSFAPKPRFVELSITSALWLLLFSMGFRIGNNAELVSSIGTIGLLGFTTAGLTILGSCVVVALAGKFMPALRFEKSAEPDPAAHGVFQEESDLDSRGSAQSALVRLKPPAILLAVVVAGFFAGLALPQLGFNPGIITEWMLNILLFLIGMQFRQSRIPLARLLRSPAVIALPMATVAGSLIGGLAIAPLFGMRVSRALALSSGFGWYSLSGVLISNLGDPVLGSGAFLANMLRESMGLILIPLLGQMRVPSMAISVAGATSMDVSLPLIEQTMGPEAVPVSFISGALLSVIVPVLVPLFMRF